MIVSKEQTEAWSCGCLGYQRKKIIIESNLSWCHKNVPNSGNKEVYIFQVFSFLCILSWFCMEKLVPLHILVKAEFFCWLENLMYKQKGLQNVPNSQKKKTHMHGKKNVLKSGCLNSKSPKFRLFGLDDLQAMNKNGCIYHLQPFSTLCSIPLVNVTCNFCKNRQEERTKFLSILLTVLKKQ